MTRTLNTGIDYAHSHLKGAPAWHPQLHPSSHGFYNADFNAYRQRTGYGGDSLLFSDVKKLPVNITIIMDPEPCLSDPEHCAPRLVGAHG